MQNEVQHIPHSKENTLHTVDVDNKCPSRVIVIIQ